MYHSSKATGLEINMQLARMPHIKTYYTLGPHIRLVGPVCRYPIVRLQITVSPHLTKLVSKSSDVEHKRNYSLILTLEKNRCKCPDELAIPHIHRMQVDETYAVIEILKEVMQSRLYVYKRRTKGRESRTEEGMLNHVSQVLPDML